MPACRFSSIVHACPVCDRVAVASPSGYRHQNRLATGNTEHFLISICLEGIPPPRSTLKIGGDATPMITSCLLCRVDGDPETASLSQFGQDTSNLGGVVMVAEHSVRAEEEDFVKSWWARGVMGGWGCPLWRLGLGRCSLLVSRHTFDISACG